MATLTRYGVRLTDNDLIMWLDDLEGLPEQQVIDALRAHRKDPDKGQFAPKVADIIRRVSGGAEEHARFAWSELRRAIRLIGPYRSVEFTDPLIAVVADEIGGWGRLCQMETEKASFIGAEFIKSYVAYKSRGIVPFHVGYLEGEHGSPPEKLPAIGVTAPQPQLRIVPRRELSAVTPEQIAKAKAEFGVKKITLKTINGGRDGAA